MCTCAQDTQAGLNTSGRICTNVQSRASHKWDHPISSTSFPPIFCLCLPFNSSFSCFLLMLHFFSLRSFSVVCFFCCSFSRSLYLTKKMDVFGLFGSSEMDTSSHGKDRLTKMICIGRQKVWRRVPFFTCRRWDDRYRTALRSISV